MRWPNFAQRHLIAIYCMRRVVTEVGQQINVLELTAAALKQTFKPFWQERRVRPRLDNTITVMHILKTGSLRYTRCLVVTQVVWECALSTRKQLLLSTYQESWISFQSVRAGCSMAAAFGCWIVSCLKLSWFCFCYLGSICLQTIWITNWLVSGVNSCKWHWWSNDCFGRTWRDTYFLHFG